MAQTCYQLLGEVVLEHTFLFTNDLRNFAHKNDFATHFIDICMLYFDLYHFSVGGRRASFHF